MQFDIKQASTYFLKDKNLIKKLFAIYGVVALFVILTLPVIFSNNSKITLIALVGMLLTLPLSVVLCFYIIGYASQNTNKRIIKPENNIPELNDWKNIFKAGGKFFLGNIVWNIIFQMAFALITIIMLIPVTIFAVALPSLETQSGNLMFAVSELGITGLIISALFILIILLYTVFNVAIYSAFYTDLRLESFFDFKKIKFILCDNFKLLIKCLGWHIILGVVFGICTLLCIITIVGIIAIPIVYATYMLIYCDIEAQFLRHIFKINKTEQLNG